VDKKVKEIIAREELMLKNALKDKIKKKIENFFLVFPIKNKKTYTVEPNEDFYSLSLKEQACVLIEKLGLDYEDVYITHSAYGNAGIFGDSGVMPDKKALIIGVKSADFTKVVQSAILSHEMTHFFLSKYEDSLKRDDYFGFYKASERDVEILSYCIGLGKIVLNGFCEDFKSEKRLKHHCSIKEQVFTFNCVNSFLGISEKDSRANLNSSASSCLANKE